MSISVRPAQPADLEAVGAITVAAYVEDGHLPRDSPYAAVLADARTRAERAELWVAVGDGGTVLGSVTFAPPGSPLAEVSDGGEGEFRMLAVAHAARGRGVGEALVRRCVQRARELGLPGLVMSTQPSMGAAHRVYDRLGFVRTPERDWEPVPGITLLTYRLTL